MAKLDLAVATASDYENTVDDAEVAQMSTDGVSDKRETEYMNTEWQTYWGYFNTHPELKTAILMKAIWNVGKGYTTDNATQVILDNIIGAGFDTFRDILFNMDVIRSIGRDSFAEIIRNDQGTLVNLKPLDPGSIRMVFDGKGIIKRYEQINKLGDSKDTVHKFRPDEMFHLSNNRLADQIHGISDIESLPSTLLAEIESFDDVRQVMHRQAKPFIIFKLKTDDQATIDALVSKIEAIRNKGNDLFIPDDENIIDYQVVEVKVSSILLDWRREVTNRFYRALGMPLILFGSANSTESGGKMEYYAHEQVFAHEQKYIEDQVWAQLALKIKLVPPQSMADNLQTDEQKDKNQGLEIQPADTTAGVGK